MEEETRSCGGQLVVVALASGGRRRRVVAVVALVGDDEHVGVVVGALHVLPRRAALHGAAPVVAEIGRAHV